MRLLYRLPGCSRTCDDEDGDEGTERANRFGNWQLFSHAFRLCQADCILQVAARLHGPAFAKLLAKTRDETPSFKLPSTIGA